MLALFSLHSVPCWLNVACRHPLFCPGKVLSLQLGCLLFPDLFAFFLICFIALNQDVLLTDSFIYTACPHFLLVVFANPYKVEILSCPGSDFTPGEGLSLGKGAELVVTYD